MNKLMKFLIPVFIVGLLLVSLPQKAAAHALVDGKVVFGETFTLKAGETVDGDLTILGGTATLENNSVVEGDTIVFGGVLTVSGTLRGNLQVIGGTVSLNDSALVEGDVSVVSGVVNKGEDATIEGIYSEGNTISSTAIYLPEGMDFGNWMDFSNLANLPNHMPLMQPIFSFNGWHIIGNVIKAAARIIILSALAMLMMLVMPKPAERVSGTVVSDFGASLGFGCLTIVVVVLGSILLLITLIIPFLAVIATGLLILFGWLAIGYEIGKRMEVMFKTTWHPAVSAGLGTLVFSFMAECVAIIPLIGWIIPPLVAVVGLGAVIITRFGTRIYVPGGKKAAAPAQAVEATDQPEAMEIAPVTPAEYPVEPEPVAEEAPKPKRKTTRKKAEDQAAE